MPSIRVSRKLNDKIYFITCTVFKWIYFFDKYNRWQVLSNSIKYCIENKGLRLFDFVFMINHIYIIVKSENVSGFLRDFKKYTSKIYKQNIIKYEPRKLWLFKNKNWKYQFWIKTNMPILLENKRYYDQKSQYIHNNPVVKGYVASPEQWYWSSANKSCELKITDEYQI
jgi:REP element-mobilizing transposase RayT